MSTHQPMQEEQASRTIVIVQNDIPQQESLSGLMKAEQSAHLMGTSLSGSHEDWYWSCFMGKPALRFFITGLLD